MAANRDEANDTSRLVGGSAPAQYGAAEQPFADPTNKEPVKQESQKEEAPKDEESVVAFIKGMTWRKRMTMITASLVNFSVMACFAMMAPYLPLEAERKGIDSTTVGMIFASFQLVNFISSITFGRFIYAIGPRFMYIAGIFIAAVCAILFGMLEWCPPGATFTAMALACRMVEALGTSMGQTASMAIISNEFPDKVATMVGLLETFSGLGMMAGPPIGGVLYEWGGFYLPFVVVGSFLFCVGVVATLILPKAAEVTPKDRSKLFRDFIKIPVVWVCGICIVTSALTLTFLDPIFSSQLAEIDPSLANEQALVGLIFLVEPVLYAILSPVVGFLSDSLKRPMPLLAIGNGGFILAYLLIGPSPLLPIPTKQLWLTIFSFGLFGLFLSLCFMPAFAAMNKACTAAGLPNDLDLFGLIGGFFGSCFNLGAFCGPLLGGFLYETYGFEWATSIVALVPIIDLVVLILYGIFLRKCDCDFFHDYFRFEITSVDTPENSKFHF